MTIVNNPTPTTATPSRARSALAVCLCLVCFPLSSLATEQFNLDSLLVKSVGGEAAREKLRQVSSFYSSGKIRLNGQPGRFEMYVAVPDMMYLRADFESFSLVQAYDGATAWSQDHNGMIALLSGYERQDLINQVYLQSYSWLFPDRLPGRTEYIGLSELDGVNYHHVSMYPLNQDTVDFYLDVSTGLPCYHITFLDNLEIVTYFNDHRIVDSVVVPFYSRATATGAPLEVVSVAEQMTFNPEFDRTVFSRPVPDTNDYRFPSRADSVVVPFEFVAGHIYLPVTLNGVKKLRMILDSGASANMFHTPALAGLELPSAGSIPAKGLGGFEEVVLVRTDSLAVGELLLYAQMAGSLDLSALSHSSNNGASFGGVLGYAFLSRFPMLIDYDRQTLTVYNPEHFSPAGGGAEIGFKLTMQIPTIEAQLVGILGDFIVDMGNPYGLIVHGDFYRVHGLDSVLSDIEDLPGMWAGIGGGVSGKSAYAATFGFGDIRISSLRVLIPDATDGLSGSTELAGNIGNLLLKQFRILFDYREQRLIFYNIAD